MIDQEIPDAVLNSVIENAKQAYETMIGSCKQSLKDLERDANTYEGCVITEMYEDVNRQIELLKALEQHIRICCQFTN